MTDLLEQHAREKLRASADWVVHTRRCLPVNSQTTHAYEVIGCVPGTKRNGKPDYKRTATERATAIIGVEEHDRWVAEWERREGRCSRCDGTGQEFASWGVDTGVTTRPCSRCDASGVTRNLRRAAAGVSDGE